MRSSGPTTVQVSVLALILVLLSGGWISPAPAAEPEVFGDRELQAAAADWLSAARFEEIHSPSSLGKGAPAMVPVNAFYEHVLTGLRSNKARRPVYEKLTQGGSRALLRKIIFLQRLFLPLAWLVDQRARRFQKRGIPIVAGDLVPVADLPAPETPPRYRGRLDPAVAKRLEAELQEFKRSFWDRVKAGDLLAATGLAHDQLIRVKALEAREGCHLAMVKHFLESVGLATLHLIGYVRETRGEVLPLGKAFIAVQLIPFRSALTVDLDAQVFHARGVGLVVNDIPAIPFEAEWDAQEGYGK